MNSFLPLLAAGESPVVEIAHQFGVTPQLLLSQVVLFIIVALALKKWAYGPILTMLEERKSRIAQAMANAEKTRAELANAQAKAQEILNQAGQQANKIVEESHAAAAAVAEKERQRAIADAQQILVKAHEAAEADLTRMKDELRKEFGRLVVDASRRATGDILTIDQHTQLAQEAGKQLAA